MRYPWLNLGQIELLTSLTVGANQQLIKLLIDTYGEQILQYIIINGKHPQFLLIFKNCLNSLQKPSKAQQQEQNL